MVCPKVVKDRSEGEGYKNFKELRKQAGLTQKELAEAIHVHRGTIIDWEKGLYPPRLEAWQFAILCSELKCTLWDIANAFISQDPLKPPIPEGGDRGVSPLPRQKLASLERLQQQATRDGHTI